MYPRVNPIVNRTLFSEAPSRTEIISEALVLERRLKDISINLWRNVGVEGYLPVIEKYLTYFGYSPIINLSGFDSSLDLRSWQSSDLDFIYYLVNEENMNQSKFLLLQRIEELYSRGSKNIAIAIQVPPDIRLSELGLEMIQSTYPSVLIQVVSEDLSLNLRQFFVTRLEVISGNWLGMDGYSLFGRLISLNLILSSIVPRIKLIAIDLDNTLYNGVLAEDGYQGISQSENQTRLVSWLLEQKDKGVMLAIVSRNQIEDVENLLATNPNWASLFDFIYANWEPKERLIDQILKVTRISQNTVLFIDDSHSEILNVQRNFPEMNLVQYYDNPETIKFLKLNPGFNAKNKSNVAYIDRALDLKSNAFRASIFANSKDDEAFKALEVVLKFKKNELGLVSRSSELSNKTNQFNFALKRFGENQISKYLKKEVQSIVLAELRDKYADSGTVSLMCLNYENPKRIVVEEFCISCRALGRGLEDEIFFGSLTEGLSHVPIGETSRIFIEYREGDRNSPVIEWVKEHGWSVESGLVDVPITSFISWKRKI